MMKETNEYCRDSGSDFENEMIEISSSSDEGLPLPFQSCRYCDKEFHDKKTLKSHIEFVHFEMDDPRIFENDFWNRNRGKTFRDNVNSKFHFVFL